MACAAIRHLEESHLQKETFPVAASPMHPSRERKARTQALVTGAVLCIALAGLEGYQALSWSYALPRAAFYSALAGMAIAVTLLVGIVVGAFRNAYKRRRSEQQFQALVDGVADHALYMLDVNGLVIAWNAGAERLKGYLADEIIGEHYSRFFTEEDRQANLPQKALEAAGRRGKHETEGWRVRRDGTRFYASAVLTALRDSSGRLTGFAKITRDVTERIQQAQMLEQTRAALAQSQKMESLGQLTGGLAHDFNNLLHVIKNAIEILRARLQKIDPEATRYLDMARRSADRAGGITQRLLAFARRQPLDPKPVNPNRLLHGMNDMLRHAVGEGIAIETVLSSGLWVVSVDANQLETAILNLTINSRDAMQRVGKLTIETANALLDESYAAAHSELRAGQYVMIAVSDTGAGMSKEVLTKAFDPFFTTKAAEEGTGLGLSQVFGFVKQSGGHVKLYSELGEGTTVKIYLPRLQAAASSALPMDSVGVESGGAGEMILVVEDQDDVRAFAMEMLTSLGYQVSGAPDGITALQLAGQLSRIDLLFTDVGLPNGLNGRQLADELRRLRPELPVLFTTGYARNAIVHHGRLDPGVELLVKPYTQLDLARKVREALRTAASKSNMG
jgi:PAS domain S-box-containing protein